MKSLERFLFRLSQLESTTSTSTIIFHQMPTSTSTNATSNTESNFRDQLSGFRWARGSNNDSTRTTTTSNPAGQGSYLSTISNSISGYVPLRSAERTNEEEAYLSLSRWERSVFSIRAIQDGGWSGIEREIELAKEQGQRKLALSGYQSY